jgi:ZIP family zinc transporter
VGLALLVAIFVSNLPEAIGSATAMKASGEGRRPVIVLWLVVAAACALATVVGYAVADQVGPSARAVVDGFAAGALLVMLTDSMIPEAKDKARDWAGLATVLGFAVAAALSKLA